jgi:hypothetical protein
MQHGVIVRIRELLTERRDILRNRNYFEAVWTTSKGIIQGARLRITFRSRIDCAVFKKLAHTSSNKTCLGSLRGDKKRGSARS